MKNGVTFTPEVTFDQVTPPLLIYSFGEYDVPNKEDLYFI